MTKLATLINPEVMADTISAEVEAAIKFAPLAKMDDTLQGQAGDTISIPKYEYIGDATVVAEGQAIDLSELRAGTSKATVKKYGKALPLTDEAVLSGYGDPVGEATEQLKKSIAAGIDNGCLNAILSTPLYVGDGAAAISGDLVAEATGKFEDEEEVVKVIFVSPLQVNAIRKDVDFMNKRAMADYGITPHMEGVIGMLGECQVVISKKIVALAGVFTNVIVKDGALTIFRKKDVEVETDRDILTKETVISADMHAVAHLADDSKAVRVLAKA